MNELPVTRGTRVYSADGFVIGTVDEFLVDQDGGHVTHLVLREGHIFGEKDVFIPVTEIETIKESDIHLALDKYRTIAYHTLQALFTLNQT